MVEINPLRKMQAKDIEQVVDVHLKAFPGFFLSFLGSRFLQELYTGILSDPSGIAMVFEDDGKIIGFVAGTDQPAGFYTRLLRQRWLRFGWASIWPVIQKPAIIPRLLRAFNTPKEADPGQGCGTLMSIAVSPDGQSKGVGRMLVTAFLDEATGRGLRQIDLTTDKLNNDSVNAFYVRLGFKCARSYVTPEGREMNEYLIELEQRP